MFNIAINNQTEVKGDYNQYAPFAAGPRQTMITEANVEEKLGSPASKHPGKRMTMVSLTIDVYGAAQDGGTRPYWENLIVDHEVAATDEKMRNFVQLNQQKLTDLILQFVKVNYNGDVSQSPFANGINPQTVGYLTQSRQPLMIDFSINKKANENEVKSFFPADTNNAGTSSQTQQQNTQQNTQAQQNVNQHQPVNNDQQPQNNGGGFNPNANLPPFHQQQRAG